MIAKLPSVVASTLETIGNTPVVHLRRIVPPNEATVYLKLETLNPTGSYKDRGALAMIEQAELRGALKPGMTVVEYTSGSAGAAFALVCALKGYRFRVVSSDAFSPEKLKTMQALGAELDIVHSPSGHVTTDLVPKLMARAKELGAADNVYMTDQFNNRDALVGYERMGRELVDQIPQGIAAFCAGVGTAGMIMGVARVLKAANRATRIVALEPDTSPAITQGWAGEHHVEGLGAGFVPPLLDRDYYDEARAISEETAREMCRRLAREEGLIVGISTGLNVAAAIDLGRRLGPDNTVVKVAGDTGFKYMAGDLF
jgi:cysteine synthase